MKSALSSFARGLIVPLLAAIAGAAVFAGWARASAETREWNVDSGATRFLAVGRPSLLKIRAEGSGPKGKLAVEKGVAKGKLEVDVNSFTSKMETRDDHMKNKSLEVGKFPKAILEVTSFPVPPMDQLPKEVPLNGTITIHGVPQPLKDLPVKLTKKSEKEIAFETKFKVSMKAHGIHVPVYAGITVTDEVDVEVQSVASAGAGGAEASSKGKAQKK